MVEPLTNPSFEEFVLFVFDHPVTDPAWYWSDDADDWIISPDVAAAYLANIFNTASTTLARYSDAQVNQGLWFLVSCGSDIVCEIIEEASKDHQDKFIDSIASLYDNCFQKRCSNHLSHNDESGANPLNSACYMWWDLFPTDGDLSQRNRDDRILEIMRQALHLDCDACRESALHGLGHWHWAYPDIVKSIIHDFLQSNVELRVQLKNYALEAAEGLVL